MPTCDVITTLRRALESLDYIAATVMVAELNDRAVDIPADVLATIDSLKK